MSAEYLYSIGGMFGPSVVMDGEIWRLFTAMFLHGGAEHIIMNMLSLYIVGRSVEMLFSKVAYLGIYFVSGLVGGLASIYFHPVSVGVGASGAIFGVFGALAGFALVHYKRMHDEFISFMRGFGIILVLNLVIGLVFPSVDLSAHIAGLVVGVIGGIFVAKFPKGIWLYVAIMTLLMVLFYNYLPVLYVNPSDVLFK
ncbi:MAG: rhomboid family intramembrane serine protease [Epsilonproteobacteria bacterium]|nr:rhomboid family intramembrane serine protease [Campylobacterota bacterium]